MSGSFRRPIPGLAAFLIFVDQGLIRIHIVKLAVDGLDIPSIGPFSGCHQGFDKGRAAVFSLGTEAADQQDAALLLVLVSWWLSYFFLWVVLWRLTSMELKLCHGGFDGAMRAVQLRAKDRVLQEFFLKSAMLAGHALTQCAGGVRHRAKIKLEPWFRMQRRGP